MGRWKAKTYKTQQSRFQFAFTQNMARKAKPSRFRQAGTFSQWQGYIISRTREDEGPGGDAQQGSSQRNQSNV